jgi:hypothetical protein
MATAASAEVEFHPYSSYSSKVLSSSGANEILLIIAAIQ